VAILALSIKAFVEVRANPLFELGKRPIVFLEQKKIIERDDFGEVERDCKRELRCDVVLCCVVWRANDWKKIYQLAEALYWHN
jgi:hypothetical protein